MVVFFVDGVDVVVAVVVAVAVAVAFVFVVIVVMSSFVGVVRWRRSLVSFVGAAVVCDCVRCCCLCLCLLLS